MVYPASRRRGYIIFTFQRSLFRPTYAKPRRVEVLSRSDICCPVRPANTGINQQEEDVVPSSRSTQNRLINWPSRAVYRWRPETFQAAAKPLFSSPLFRNAPSGRL